MGKPKKGTLLRLLHKQGGRCYYCNDSISTQHPQGHPNEATIDHRLPRSLGGDHGRNNIVAACYACNQAKADMTAQQFIAQLEGYA